MVKTCTCAIHQRSYSTMLKYCGKNELMIKQIVLDVKGCTVLQVSMVMKVK